MTWFVAQPQERCRGGEVETSAGAGAPLAPHCLGTPCTPFPTSTRGSLQVHFYSVASDGVGKLLRF